MIEADIVMKALKHYGHDHQMIKCIEECAELTDALIKYRDGRVTKEDVISEIADVHIMLYQMMSLFGADDVALEFKRKLNRLNERIENERNRQ